MDDLELYAGRWVATDERDRIVAVAFTAEAVERAGNSLFPKEHMRFYYITPQPPYLALPRDPLHLVFTLAEDRPVWIVGGAVRDLILHRPLHDWDFTVAQGAARLARRVADALGGAFYLLDPERDTARVILPHLALDFATLRGATIEEDLRLRDFTLNALALTPRGELLDPTGGLDDLRARRLRQTSPRAFADDPLRLLRAIRLAAQLHLRVEAATWQALRAAAPTLREVAAERVQEELRQIVALPAAGLAFRRMKESGLLAEALPPLATLPPAVWKATLTELAAVEALLAALEGNRPPAPLSPRLRSRWREGIAPLLPDLRRYLAEESEMGLSRRHLIKWGMLLRPLPHPQVEALLEQLRFARRTRRFLLALLEGDRHFDRLAPMPDRRRCYRFYRRAEEAAEAAALLGLGRALARPPAAQEAALAIAARLLRAGLRERDRVVHPPRLLDGRDLLALGLPPGPAVGKLLAELEEAQAAGEIADREAALALARRRIQSPADDDR